MSDKQQADAYFRRLPDMSMYTDHVFTNIISSATDSPQQLTPTAAEQGTLHTLFWGSAMA